MAWRVFLVVMVVLGVGLWKAASDAANSHFSPPADVGETARVELGNHPSPMAAPADAAALQTLMTAQDNPKNDQSQMDYLVQVLRQTNGIVDVLNGDRGTVTHRYRGWTAVQFTAGFAHGRTAWLPSDLVVRDS